MSLSRVIKQRALQGDMTLCFFEQWDMTLPRLLMDRARQFKDRVLFHFENKSQTYGEYDENTSRLAEGLNSLGVKKGDRVATLLQNSPEIMESFFAVWKLGAVVVPINVMATPREIEFYCNDCGVKVIIVSEPYWENMKAAKSAIPSLEKIVTTGNRKIETTVSYQTLKESSGGIHGEKNISPYDLAMIMYTAGTTGRPKGVMLSHKNFIANANAFQALAGPLHAESDIEHSIYLVAVPFFHLMAVAAIWIPGIWNGTTLVIMERYDPEKAMKLIEHHKVNAFGGVPQMLAMMMSHDSFGKYDLKSLRSCGGGGGLASLELKKGVAQKFGVRFSEAYGQTESCSFISAEFPDMEDRPGSCGIALPGQEVRIVDENDQNLSSGEVGELLVRGPNVMMGYWNDPQETAEALRGGWLHTGDLLRQDDDGYLYFVDRVKDMIKMSGFNIYPREVEDVLMGHPAVAEAAVVGVPHPLKGQLVKSFIITKPGRNVTEEQIVEYCRGRLSSYKIPKIIEFVSSFPRSVTFKVLKRKLRKEKT